MRVISGSVNETLRIGKIIAKNLQKGDIVCLFGNLGSGKTVLTKGIASGLGINRENIVSPTFILIRQYQEKGAPLYHFDLYRLRSIKDILDLGYEEYFYGSGISVIEWADRLKCLMPKEHLKIELAVSGHRKRTLKFYAKGARHKELLRKINENIRH